MIDAAVGGIDWYASRLPNHRLAAAPSTLTAGGATRLTVTAQDQFGKR